MSVETTQIIQLSSGPAADWTSNNPILPTGMIGYESDTNKFKIGDNVTPWTTLGYTVDAQITAEHLALIDAANTAGGICVLTEAGTVPLSLLPTAATEHVKFVANIDARNAIPYDERTCMIVVLDAAGDIINTQQAISYTLTDLYDAASDELDDGGVAVIDFGSVIASEPTGGETTGDLTVNTGGAVYAWRSTGETTGIWIKISEFESMDIDFTVYLNTIVDTLDDINDGTNYVKLSVAEKSKLEITLVKDDTQHISGVTPAQLAANVT